MVWYTTHFTALIFRVSLNKLYLRRRYTVKCFVQLVSQCFGDIVAGQVARNIFHSVISPVTAKIFARQVARAVA